ncbi:TIGR02679 family protein [uncultured Pseudokineococcus sp.]|uniref:TIGR02679 family protein n=1 Tax=uncultured Pseudokineococcus sp. TaxID=1642928 RepID=UPI00262DDB34|nr:TIGR02679 family protein [uncultured Pseudokineococcus sp.]
MKPPRAQAGLPAALRDHLADPSLAVLWQECHAKLERNRLEPRGVLEVDLDETGADRLGDLLRTPVRPGPVRLRAARLDEALRASAARRGLLAVVSELVGPVIDRSAARDARAAERAGTWTALEGALAAVGLAAAPWVPVWEGELRRNGVLTRLPPAEARRVVDAVAHVLAALPLTAAAPPVAERDLGALASMTTGDAHGLDDGRPLAAVVLRGVAAARGETPPESPAGRRALWAAVGVSTDAVSGTVLTWGLRPPEDDAWSASLRARADLGLVTHLTVQELTSSAAVGVALTRPGVLVSVCENPQVLQAAARAGVTGPLVCTSGNPSSAGWLLLDRLVDGGADVRYHGDLDWPGVAIAARVLARGARPWRLTGEDYEEAVDAQAGVVLPLAGRPAPTPWDERLAATMRRHGVAVHEEAVLAVLLGDL